MAQDVRHEDEYPEIADTPVFDAAGNRVDQPEDYGPEPEVQIVPEDEPAG